MKIIRADHAGFCFGVKRAIQLAEEYAQKQRVFCWGPLIHNRQEIKRLEKLGVFTGNEENPCMSANKNDIIMIRTHGINPRIISALEDKGWQVVDVTCPYVKKAQNAAKEAQQDGYQVIILGDQNHPEVLGLKAWANDKAIIVASKKELINIELSDKVAVMAQTTEKEARFIELVEYLKERFPQLRVYPTICSATMIRQNEAFELAKAVDLMIIIGGRHSSNTQKLWDICRSVNPESYLVEEAGELKMSWFKNKTVVGVSAGASTPDWIINEIIQKMEGIMEQMENMPVDEKKEETAINFDEQLDFRRYNSGDIIKGIVVKVNADEVIVDIKGKSEGIVSREQFSYNRVDPREHVKEGQEILVEFLKEDKEGNIILSCKRARVEEALSKLEDAKEKGETVVAPVIEIVKGGLLVDVGIRGFVPVSQIERTFVEDLNQYLNKELRLRVLEINRDTRKAVLSQRVLLEEEYQQKKKKVWEELEEGQNRKGIVKRLSKFGAFVDIGGIDGLLHVSEMGWGRIEKPSDVVNEGDEIEVTVIKVDRDNEKVSLSLKDKIKDPWEQVPGKYQPGMMIEGKVVRTVPFGAFIELCPGVDGLIHISQLSVNRVNRVEEVLSIGQTVKAKIIEIDLEKKRISLSIKDIDEDAGKAEYETFLEEQPEEKGVTIGEILEVNKDE